MSKQSGEKQLLLSLLLSRETYQKQRIAFKNRIEAIDSGKSPADFEIYQQYVLWYERFLDDENEILDVLVDRTKHIPIVNVAQSVKGIGPTFAIALYAFIDIRKADTISSLWKYAGQGVTDGKADRPTKGVKLSYNAGLKRLMYNIGTSFLRTRSPYADIRYTARLWYDEHRSDWTALHREFAARRKMYKQFLAHYWLVWRTLEGLPTRPPYVEEYLGHSKITQPSDFGWELEYESTTVW